MAALSKKLRSVGSDTTAGIAHWCPGCKSPHVIYTKGKVTWTWDGNVDAPTCTPSVRNFTTYDKEHNPLPAGQERTLCHYVLTNGILNYCGDCEHELSGQSAPLPDWPEPENK